MKKGMYYETKFGNIGIAEEDGAVTNVFFGNTVAPKDFEVMETPLLRTAIEQLNEYFDGKRKKFDLPLQWKGTDFECSVWDALLAIHYGETRTYGEIAEQIGKPKAYRAVGRANRLNPISIFVPCHRVIGADKTLTGYAGGVPMKEQLLKLEEAGTN